MLDSTSEQFKLEFAEWSVQRVRRALMGHFGIEAGRDTVRRAMHQLKLTPRMPKFRPW